jgi:hypothetical protein
MAVNITPPADRNQANWPSNLGSDLGARFQETKAMGDLDKVIRFADEIVSATPLDDPGRATWLNNLGLLLTSRFKKGVHDRTAMAAYRMQRKRER